LRAARQQPTVISFQSSFASARAPRGNRAINYFMLSNHRAIGKVSTNRAIGNVSTRLTYVVCTKATMSIQYPHKTLKQDRAEAWGMSQRVPDMLTAIAVRDWP
jgi:hypothetical protein